MTLDEAFKKATPGRDADPALVSSLKNLTRHMLPWSCGTQPFQGA